MFKKTSKIASSDSKSYYNEVPDTQYQLFSDFNNNHPYTTISCQDKKFKYISSGQGNKTLVFLSGALVLPNMWFYPASELEKTYRILIPCFPIQGMEIKEAANIIQAILSKEQIKKVILIGYSYGGGIAQYFAEKHPEIIEKLILSHTGILKKTSAQKKLTKAFKILQLIPFFLLKLAFRKRITNYPYSNWNEFHQAYFKTILVNLSKQLFLDFLEINIKSIGDLPEEIENFRKWQGKTVLLATKDDKDTFKHLDSLKVLYPKSEVYVFNEAGGHHMLFLYPEKYTSVLKIYIEDN